MSNNLKLITTETFGDLSCNFYRNMNDDILLTREQIGQALEYSDPSMCIRRIHLKHKDRLEPLCVRIKLGEYQNGTNLSKSEEQERVYYTERGIMEICRWSRQPKANIFMDWVWDIIEKYRHNELQPNLQSLIDSLSILTQTITTMQQDINSLKESQLQKKPPEKKYSRWKTNTFNKLNTLLSYINTHSEENMKLSKIIHLVIQETEDTYDIEISDYVEAYKSEFAMDTNPYAIDVINHYKDIKDMFTLTLDSIMNRLNLSDNTKSANKNIFDILAEEINNTLTDKAS
jgi:prophage antirepressor-like protein